MRKEDVPCVSMHIGSYTSELTKLDIFWPKVSDLSAGSGVHLHLFLESGYPVCHQYHELDRLILWGAIHILWILGENNCSLKMELGCHSSVIWVSLGCHWGVIGVSLGCYWGVTGVSLGCYMGVVEVSLGCHFCDYLVTIDRAYLYPVSRGGRIFFNEYSGF